MNLISIWHATGLGVEQDYVEAVYWARLAAQLGLVDAQANFSVALANGQGINVDLVQSHKWSNLAAANGHPTAQEFLTSVSQMMNKAQIDQAGYLAGTWSPKELTEAQLKQLSQDLGIDDPPNKDGSESAYSFEFEDLHDENIQSAQEGNPYAQTNVGHAFMNGMGVDVDIEQAYAWYMKAAEQGYDQAQYQVGNLHNSGVLGAADVRLALEWWEKAANQNYPPAQYNSGIVHLGGRSIKADLSQAYVWLALAADSYLEKFLANRGPDLLLEHAEDAVKARDSTFEQMSWWKKTKAFGKLRAWREHRL